MVNILSLLLGVITICALISAAAKLMLGQPKVWEREPWFSTEIEGTPGYEEIRQENPHIWLDNRSLG